MRVYVYGMSEKREKNEFCNLLNCHQTQLRIIPYQYEFIFILYVHTHVLT